MLWKLDFREWLMTDFLNPIYITGYGSVTVYTKIYQVLYHIYQEQANSSTVLKVFLWQFNICTISQRKINVFFMQSRAKFTKISLKNTINEQKWINSVKGLDKAEWVNVSHYLKMLWSTVIVKIR